MAEKCWLKDTNRDISLSSTRTGSPNKLCQASHQDKPIESPLCNLSAENSETVYHHIVSECNNLAQLEYRHDDLARLAHWHLYKKYNIKLTDKWLRL